MIGCGIGGAIAVIILVITMAFPGSTVTSDNSILVDPQKKTESFVLARVMIKNQGNQPLTNITIDYGDGDKDFIPILKPGKTMILSPPDGNSLQFCTSDCRWQC